MYYRDHGSFPENKEKLGHVLGPIKNEGNKMAQAVLTFKGTIVPCCTIQKLALQQNSVIQLKKRNDLLLMKLLERS